MDSLKLASIVVHVADARTCVLNPAGTTHRQLTDEQLAAANIPAGLVRLSVGIENADDIIVLEDGRIAERGTHDALISQGGVYKKLYDMQAL